MADRDVVVAAANRRMLRRLRSHWRHEQFSIRMALAGAAHHSHMRVASMSTQTDFVPAATYYRLTSTSDQVCGSDTGRYHRDWGHPTSTRCSKPTSILWFCESAIFYYFGGDFCTTVRWRTPTCGTFCCARQSDLWGTDRCRRDDTEHWEISSRAGTGDNTKILEVHFSRANPAADRAWADWGAGRGYSCSSDRGQYCRDTSHWADPWVDWACTGLRNSSLPRRRPRIQWKSLTRAPRRPAAIVVSTCTTHAAPSYDGSDRESIEKETERAASMMEPPLPEPPMVEPPMVDSDRAPAKRRRRTRYSPLPGIMENAVYLAPSSWPPTRRAWLCGRCARWQYGRGAWHPPTLSWVPPNTSPAWQATGRASCAYVCRALPFAYPSCFLCLSPRKTAHPSFTCSPCTWRSRRLCSCTPGDARQAVCWTLMTACRLLYPLLAWDLAEYLMMNVTEREYSHRCLTSKRNCATSADYDTVHKSTAEMDKEKTYQLRDENFITVGAERFRCAEVLFLPWFHWYRSSGLHDTSLHYIMKCDVYIRKKVVRHVVLSNGPTMFQGVFLRAWQRNRRRCLHPRWRSRF